MTNLSIRLALLAALGGALCAQNEVLVTSDITTSTTWTANNRYNLQQQIYVLPGATLTIEAGTVIASDVTANGSGALAVTRGAQIHIQGTQQNPVIFTSKNDTATWVNNDPKTGTWRAAANEWGNLTIMGAGYVSENAVVGNTPAPNPANVATMEGLTAAFPGDSRVLYGGGNDNDDSGSIAFCSIRYAGRVVGLANELNGMSLGGIGRNTEIHHVEVMNNVDDGIEIWGGTVNLKYVSVWNVGDDSIDVDQGWRGKLQFGLIVQGYSVAAAQGSGVGDNCFETDGAEDSFWQPITTATIYNCTVIGQPGSTGGDHGTAWRDNAHVQYRNCIFMDLGERLVAFDNVDGDGGSGYGFNGTLSWANCWTTPHTYTEPVNAPANPGAFYTVQTSGNLCEIKDSVFFNNTNAAAYTEANNRGVNNPANNNVTAAAGSSPITAITRGAPQTVFGTLVMRPVTFLDPRPANAALTSVGFAPKDGFFSSAKYRGAFAPGNNWLAGWTASEAYGFTPRSGWADLGTTSASPVYGDPVLTGTGPLTGGSVANLALSNAAPNAIAFLCVSLGRNDQFYAPLGGTLVCDPITLVTFLTLCDAQGSGNNALNVPSGFAGVTLYNQSVVLDATSPSGFSISNGLASTWQ